MEKVKYGKFALPYIIDIMNKRKISYSLNGTYSGKCVIVQGENKNIIFWDYPFNINTSSSIKVCKNKDICTHFLKINGLSVPNSENFTRLNKQINSDLIPLMYDFITTEKIHNKGIEYPFIIKPSTLSQGEGIKKINSLSDALSYFDQINNIDCKTFIIQEFCKGNDYRVVVLGNTILQAYQRVPFHIIGDGTSKIYDLVEKKIEEFKNNDRDKLVDINDSRIWDSVLLKGKTKNDILKPNEKLVLQELANLSLGGTSVDITNKISNYYKEIAIKTAQKLNLDLCGIDIIAEDLTDDKKKTSIKY